MRKYGRILAGLAFALGPMGFAWCQHAALTPEQIYDRISPSVWLVEADHGDGAGSMGSAVVIGTASLITNCHVIDKAKSIFVSHDRRRIPARLEYRDPVRDLCQLEARGIAAPVVLIASARTLRPGSKVYAIGNPRGLELTISDGLVSGLRHDQAGELQYIQISVPISPGSSGGGLFDVHGRLVGVTTAGLRDSQNLNFALPADWIADLARRSADPNLARLAPAPPQAPAVPSDPAEPPPATPQPGLAISVGRRFEYRVRDRLTGVERTVTYEVDKVDGERVRFNSGSRIETPQGVVIELNAPIAGEMDVAMPPGGWVQPGTRSGATWTASYHNNFSHERVGMQVRARAGNTTAIRVGDREVQALRVEIEGYTTRGGRSLERDPTGPYQAVVWYAPEIGRVVRFEARSRGGVGGAVFIVDELAELVNIR